MIDDEPVQLGAVMSGGSGDQGLDAPEFVPAERLAGTAGRWIRHLDGWTLLEIAPLAIVASVAMLVVGYVIGAVASTLQPAAITAELATEAWANPLVAIVLLASSLVSWYEVTRSCEFVELARNEADDSRSGVAEWVVRVRRSRRLGTASLVLSLVTVFGALALLVADTSGLPGVATQPFQYLSAAGSFVGTLIVAAASGVSVARLRARSEALVD